jgi:hypothetical protein
MNESNQLMLRSNGSLLIFVGLNSIKLYFCVQFSPE